MFGSVLALAPHNDDVVLGAGGTLARCLDEGDEVHVAVFSTTRASHLEHLPENVIENEAREALGELGIEEDRLAVMDFPLRHFPERRQEVLRRIEDLKERVDPDVVLGPPASDSHQDHQVVAAEAARVFRDRTLLGYETTWNETSFPRGCFVPLAEAHVDRKIQAFRTYKTLDHREFLDAELLRGTARMRGSQIERRWAEAFDVVQWVPGRGEGRP